MKIELTAQELDAYNKLRNKMAELPANSTIHYSDYKVESGLF